MELVKKNIQTDRIKAKTLFQLPIEEDINVSDTRPDVGKLVFYRGKVKIDEIKTAMNKVWVKGKLVYQVLYTAEGKESGLAGMEGELPFMEEIYMESVEGQDRVVCTADLEDMRVNMINSRKLNIQAVIALKPCAEEIATQEVCVQLNKENTLQQGTRQMQGAVPEQLEYRKKILEYLETIVCKRDLFRIHEDHKLPAAVPAIGKILWKSADINHVKFKPMGEKINVSGEISIFIMYTDDNQEKTNWYEGKVPFSGEVECQGCNENMVADISYEVGHEEITIREDGDGESRLIGIEMTLELEIKLLSRDSTQIVSDVYGVTCEVEAMTEPKQFKSLYQDVDTEEKISGIMKLEDTEPKILQICHSDAKVEVDECDITGSEAVIKGNLQLRMLYIAADDNEYYMAQQSQPFDIRRQIQGVKNTVQYTLHAQIEQLNISIKEGNQAQWDVVLDIKLLIYDVEQEDILTEIKISELDSSKIEKLPGFAIYFVREGDTLWQIGRKYYVSVDKIKEINQLTSDEIKAGDKLLIVKSGEV